MMIMMEHIFIQYGCHLGNLTKCNYDYSFQNQ